MRALLRPLLLGALLTCAAAAPALAQSGFALKGGYIYNRSDVDASTRVSGANGFGVGAEFVVPIVNLGVGVSAYSGGKVTEFDAETSKINVVAEANYFLKLPMIPVAPYAGVHVGMGHYSQRDDSTPSTRPQDGWRQVGYQAGLRVQLVSLLGVDAQLRRVSSSLATNQDSALSRTQVVVGVTLF
jgi:hypothetical protein